MRIMIIGYGRMGKMIEEAAKAEGMEIGAVIDVENIGDLKNITERFDVVFDFSSPSSLHDVSAFIKKTGSPYLCGCTGHNTRQNELIESLGQYAPVIHAANYSLGVAVVKRALEMMTPVLRDSFDIEIMETHHNQKVDAPSGTAYLLAEAIDPAHEYELVYDRHDIKGKRGKNEIGMVSRRGGNCSGEHTVSFFGEDEVIEVVHKATSRRIFVNGAVKVSKVLKDKPNGYYTIEQILF